MPCRVVMKPMGVKGPDCEQGGCFVLPGCHETAGRQGAGLRTRGLFYPAGVSGRRWTPSGRTANKGVVLPCRGIRTPMDAKWPDCEQGGCFTLPGYHDADGRQVAGLRTRGLFYPAGVSGRRWTPRGRTANKGVVLPCWVVMKPMGVKGPDCEQGGCFALPGCHETAGRQGAGLRTRGLFCPAGLP